jgi:cyclic 2,3-diphosphoglycerate synthetase
VIVCMGRGGPPQPQLAEAGTSLEELARISQDGLHAASDYLEGAALAGVATVGCRRVGGGLAGEPAESNVAEGAALAASRDPDALLFEGSGACIPPVVVDRTVCMVGDRSGALDALGPYRLLRADLALVIALAPSERESERLAAAVAEFSQGRVMRCSLEAQPAQELAPGARVALFTTGPASADSIDPVVTSDNLARRAALAADLDRAAAEGCDTYLTELKAGAIDTVAERAAREGARVVFLRNRPVGLDGDLDQALVKLYEDA